MVVSRLLCSVAQFDGENISQLKQYQNEQTDKKSNTYVTIAFLQGCLLVFFNCTVAYTCADKLVELLI